MSTVSAAVHISVAWNISRSKRSTLDIQPTPSNGFVGRHYPSIRPAVHRLGGVRYRFRRASAPTARSTATSPIPTPKPGPNASLPLPLPSLAFPLLSLALPIIVPVPLSVDAPPSPAPLPFVVGSPWFVVVVPVAVCV